MKRHLLTNLNSMIYLKEYNLYALIHWSLWRRRKFTNIAALLNRLFVTCFIANRACTLGGRDPLVYSGVGACLLRKQTFVISPLFHGLNNFLDRALRAAWSLLPGIKAGVGFACEWSRARYTLGVICKVSSPDRAVLNAVFTIAAHLG